jgi:YesN/AraC family two-component response regulator
MRGKKRENFTIITVGFMYRFMSSTDESNKKILMDKPVKILIVEDDETQRKVLRLILEKSLSCEIIEAKNGVEALRQIENSEPDIMFLDIWMPVMNGIQVVERMKEMPKYHSTPTIVLSAISDRETIARIISLGVRDFILKPLHRDQIMDRLSKILPSIKLAENNLA